MTDPRLEIAEPLAEFAATELSAPTGISPESFWNSLAGILETLGPRVRDGLERRSLLQSQIDERWRRLRPSPGVGGEKAGSEGGEKAGSGGGEKAGSGGGEEAAGAGTGEEAGEEAGFGADEQAAFLRSIGYLVPEPDHVQVSTRNVDPEIARIAGPQLVVPIDNARYALNAANARWGSLYDALYGTDVISEADGCERGEGYNPVRGIRVIGYVRKLLDRHYPLTGGGSHADASAYRVADGGLEVFLEEPLDRSVSGASGWVGLEDPGGFAGYVGNPSQPEAILLCKHGIHLEILFNPASEVGRSDRAGVSDVRIESALTTIMDLEDSVATVDAHDKVLAYRNWLGLMRGDLEATFKKGGRTLKRKLNCDTEYLLPDGRPAVLRRLSVMLVRIVGLELKTNSVLFEGKPIPETILDAAMAAWCALGNRSNSRTGSVYVVCPKLHGPEEVALVYELLGRLEEALGMESLTLKMGIMDEERRTSLNLAACLAEASDRVVFINTGFLDRTGDEIHTNMEAGAMIPKGEMKTSTWLNTYEKQNVAVGLRAGLRGRGQIGKGMWARPDDMAAMLTEKVAHPASGASTAWVPSPTAASLHALHYLEVDVDARAEELLRSAKDAKGRHGGSDGGSDAAKGGMLGMLEIPVIAPDRKLNAEEIRRELENNLQGILGYVSRWVGMGVGCSKVPDIEGVALMEDRATLRISSQHVANWLHHGVVGEGLVRSTMERMAEVVDRQNAGDDAYHPMSPDFNTSIPFQAATALVFEGRNQPNGYTEKILNHYRRQMKTALGAKQ